jgi:hypothetical protein
MKKNVVEAKDVKLRDGKLIEAVEPTTQDIELDGWDMEQREIGGQVAQALAVLTAAGVIQWEVGSEWARSCLCVHVGKYDPLVVCERGEWPEDLEFGEVGEPRQEFCGFDNAEYMNLIHHIHRNWVYPDGY